MISVANKENSTGYLNMGKNAQLNTQTFSVNANGVANIQGGIITSTAGSALNVGSKLYMTSGSAITGSAITMAGATSSLDGASITIQAAGAPADFEAIELADLVVAGTGASITLDLNGYTGGNYALTIISASGITGEENLSYSFINGGNGANVGFNWIDSSTGGKDLVASITAIPEPATAAMLIGLIGLAATATRRRR